MRSPRSSPAPGGPRAEVVPVLGLVILGGASVGAHLAGASRLVALLIGATVAFVSLVVIRVVFRMQLRDR